MLEVKRYQHVHLDESLILHELVTELFNDGIMIDVGSHMGTVTIPFLESGWQVYAFEPNPLNSQHLFNKIRDKGIQSADLLRFSEKALSAQPESERDFYFSDISSGISGLSDFHESHSLLKKVEVSTLGIELGDTQTEARKIRFLKIDTEGFDLFVLKGFNWNNMRHPDFIECEFENGKTESLGYSTDDLIQFLEELGYTILISEWYPIKEYGLRHDWRALRSPREQLDTESWGNIIAFKEPDIKEQIIEQFQRCVPHVSFYEPILNTPVAKDMGSVGDVTSTKSEFTLNSNDAYIRFPFRAHFLPGLLVVGEIELELAASVELTLRLIRHGGGGAEGKVEKMPLPFGRHKLLITHVVERYQTGFALQLQIDRYPCTIKVIGKSIETQGHYPSSIIKHPEAE